jgi:hypothetical protein
VPPIVCRPWGEKILSLPGIEPRFLDRPAHGISSIDYLLRNIFERVVNIRAIQ